MSQFSKILTVAPFIVGFAMIGADFFFQFEFQEAHVQLIEFMIGSTVAGGITNAGFKKYVAYKEKIKS